MARYNRFMGEYSPNTEYQKGDVVTFGGAAWYRKIAGKGISPIAVKKPYMVWSRMNDDLSTVFPLGGAGSSGTGGGSLAQTYTDMTPGYVNVKTGAFGTGGNWQRTDYIPVSSGDVVTFSGRIGDNMGVAGYDENKAFVASVLDRIDEGSANTYVNEPLTIPDGVAYIAGCTNSPSNPITVMVYKDAKALVENARFVVNVTTEDMSTYTADKTMEEIVAAHKAGVSVVAVMKISTGSIAFDNVLPFTAYAEQDGSIMLCTFSAVGLTNGECVASALNMTPNGLAYESRVLAEKVE